MIQNAYWLLKKMKKFQEMRDAKLQGKNSKIAAVLYKILINTKSKIRNATILNLCFIEKIFKLLK